MRSQMCFMRDVKASLFNKRDVHANLRAKEMNRMNAWKIKKCDSDEDEYVEAEYDSDESVMNLEELKRKVLCDPSLQPVVKLEKLSQETINNGANKCHLNILHDKMNNSDKKEKMVTSKPEIKIQTCPECCKSFKSRNNFLRHLKSHKEKKNSSPNEHNNVEDNLEEFLNPSEPPDDRSVKDKVSGKRIKVQVAQVYGNEIENKPPELKNEQLVVNEKLTKNRKTQRKDKITTRGKIHKCANSRKSVLDKNSKTQKLEKQCKNLLIPKEVNQHASDSRKQKCNSSKIRSACNTIKALGREHRRSTYDNSNDKETESIVPKVDKMSRYLECGRKILDKENQLATDDLSKSILKIDKRGNASKRNIKEIILTPTAISKFKSSKSVSRKGINTTERNKNLNGSESVCTLKNKRRKMNDNDNKVVKKTAGKSRKKDKSDDAETKSTEDKDESSNEKLLVSATAVLENIDTRIAKVNVNKYKSETKNKWDPKLESTVKKHSMNTRSTIKTKVK